MAAVLRIKDSVLTLRSLKSKREDRKQVKEYVFITREKCNSFRYEGLILRASPSYGTQNKKPIGLFIKVNLHCRPAESNHCDLRVVHLLLSARQRLDSVKLF